MKIKITCTGSKYVDFNSLKIFQGDLKEISDENFSKLKKSILKYGFSFPAFVWGDYILDGTHRTKVIKSLLVDGYSIDKIPVVEIEAKDKQEAAEKLLALNNHYAKFTDQGLIDFIDEFEIDLVGLDLELPDVDIGEILRFIEEGQTPNDIQEVDEVDESVNFIIKCESISELETLKANLKISGSKIKYENFKEFLRC